MNPAADARPDLVRACLAEPVPRTPVWFMRQAGRALPEYRAARGEGSILSAIGDAPLAAELTLQPVRRYGVDAAILFSDIVVPVHAIGFGVEVEQGRGPVVAEPFRSEADLARLRPFRTGCRRPVRGRSRPAGQPGNSQGRAPRSSASPARRSPWPAISSRAGRHAPSPR